MRERIEAIIKHEGLSPSQFADVLGVQRSGISHILSGRNKPSLDFLNKLLNHFPHISGDWLITGKGEMIAGAKTSVNSGHLLFPDSETDKTNSRNTENTTVKEETKPVYKKHIKEEPKQPLGSKNESKRIERVVIFYSDKTFTEYIPE